MVVFNFNSIFLCNYSISVTSGVTVSENPDAGSVKVKIKLPKPLSATTSRRRPFDDGAEETVGESDNARGLYEVMSIS